MPRPAFTAPGENYMATQTSPSAQFTNPEPFTVRDVLVFTVPALLLFSAMFTFFFSLSSM